MRTHVGRRLIGLLTTLAPMFAHAQGALLWRNVDIAR